MKKRYLITILLLVLLPINVKAASISVSCNKSTADSNTTVVCKVYAKDSKVSGAEGSVSVTNGTIVSQSKLSCEIGSVTSKGFECVDTEVNNSLQVVSYTIKVGSEGTTTFKVTNGKVVGNNYDTISVGASQVTININKVTPKKETKKEETKKTDTDVEDNKKEENKEIVIKPEKETKTEYCKPDSYHKFIEIYAIVITVMFGLLSIYSISKKGKVNKI